MREAQQDRAPVSGGATTFAGSELAVLRGGRPVFSGLSFSVGGGRALRLAGPNGGGKTTLIRAMAGLLRPGLGTIVWNDVPIAEESDEHAARLAFLGHSDCLKPALTARENGLAGLRLRGRGRAWSEAALDRAFETLSVSRLADLPAGWLSSGQRRRVALAGVLASEARLWLLDEPTVGLDAASVRALETALRDHLKRDGIVVAATHTAIDLGDEAGTLDPAAFAPRPETIAELGGGWGIA